MKINWTAAISTSILDIEYLAIYVADSTFWRLALGQARRDYQELAKYLARSEP